MIDSSFGFEMETFEFLNICQVHGFPRIMGVLTHMDMFKSFKQLKKTKKRLKHRFWTEIYQGAKLFYLNGLVNAEYKKQEVHNLARFISVMKFKEMGFRSNHPFLIADRMEDLTEPDLIRQNAKCDRNVCLYGYVRGCPLKRNTNIHIPGVGDFELNDVSFLPDPCPLPNSEKHHRTLDERERLIYAPFSGVGGIVYDKDAVYIELGGSHSHNKSNNEKAEIGAPTNEYVGNIISSKHTLDAKLQQSKLKIFSETMAISNEEYDENASKAKVEEEEEEKDIEMEEYNSDDDQEDDDEDIDEDEFSEDEESGEDDDYDNSFSSRWKENLKLKASLNFEKNKKVNWTKLVYGNQPSNSYFEEDSNKKEDLNEEVETTKEFGGLFKVTKNQKDEKS
jgi:ribosome biogenesis protein BMS1